MKPILPTIIAMLLGVPFEASAQSLYDGYLAQTHHGSEPSHDAGFYIPEDVQKSRRERGPEPRRRKARGPRPWYVPRAALGVGLNVPELLPFEGWLFFGRHVALRAFYTPELPFNIRIEMPSDVISTKKGVGVANPEFTIRLKAYYGPHYGLEGLAFPFGGSFFVGGGAAYRAMRLVGSAKSAILVCSIFEVAKEPPCPDPAASLRPDTKLQLDADARTSAILLRGMLGWFWDVGDWGYLSLQAGATRPTQIRRKVSVVATLDTPGSAEEDQDITGALAQVKAEREAELERKAIKEMRPVDTKLLPILGLSAGVRF